MKLVAARCTATIVRKDKSTAQCVRTPVVGPLCKQHAKTAIRGLESIKQKVRLLIERGRITAVERMCLRTVYDEMQKPVPSAESIEAAIAILRGHSSPQPAPKRARQLVPMATCMVCYRRHHMNAECPK